MPEQPASHRVLVVSDEKDTGRFLGRLLEDAGLAVVICPVDDVAIELASSFPPFDAVLGDSISDMDVRRVRNLADPDRAATPVVILAPHDSADLDAEAATAAGATSYHPRPIAEHDLMNAIHAALPETGAEPDKSESEADDDG